MLVETYLCYSSSKEYIFLTDFGSDFCEHGLLGPVFWHHNQPIIEQELEELFKRKYKQGRRIEPNNIPRRIEYIYLNEDLNLNPISNEDLRKLSIFGERFSLKSPPEDSDLNSDSNLKKTVSYEINNLTHECKISLTYESRGNTNSNKYIDMDRTNHIPNVLDCVSNKSIILYLNTSGKIFVRNFGFGQPDYHLMDNIVSIGVTKPTQCHKKEIYAISENGNLIIIRDKSLDESLSEDSGESSDDHSDESLSEDLSESSNDPMEIDSYLEAILNPYDPIHECYLNPESNRISDSGHNLESEIRSLDNNHETKIYNDTGNQVHLYDLTLNKKLAKGSFKSINIFLTQDGDLFSNYHKNKIASDVKDFIHFRDFVYYQDKQGQIFKFETKNKYRRGVLLEELTGASFIPSFPKTTKSARSRQF